MIIKEWSKEELDNGGYVGFNDKILSKFYGADIYNSINGIIFEEFE